MGGGSGGVIAMFRTPLYVDVRYFSLHFTVSAPTLDCKSDSILLVDSEAYFIMPPFLSFNSAIGELEGGERLQGLERLERLERLDELEGLEEL